MWALTTDPQRAGTVWSFPLTFVFLCIPVELPCSQDKLAVVWLVLGFHPATPPGICTNKCRFSCTAVTHKLLIHHWWCIGAGALGMCYAARACFMWLPPLSTWVAVVRPVMKWKNKTAKHKGKGNSGWPEERCAVGGGGWGDRQGLMIAGGEMGDDWEEGRGERGGQKMNSAHVE